jgi:L-glyceraldehyde 3-phosphate reductase
MEMNYLPKLNSKVEIRAANLGDVAGHIVRSCEESLSRLGIDVIDMFQIHNGPTNRPLEMKGAFYAQLDMRHYPAAMEGIRHLLESGKIRYAGFICRGNDAEEVREVLDSGLFRLINIPYTLLNPTAGMEKSDGLTVDKDFGNEIGLAKARGASAAIYSPLASGVLTDDFLAGIRHPLAKPLGAQPAERVAALRFLREATGASLAQAAIRFVLMNEGVATALGGFSAIEQLEETAKVPDLPPLSPEAMKRLDALWRADFRPS